MKIAENRVVNRSKCNADIWVDVSKKTPKNKRYLSKSVTVARKWNGKPSNETVVIKASGKHETVVKANEAKTDN